MANERRKTREAAARREIADIRRRGIFDPGDEETDRVEGEQGVESAARIFDLVERIRGTTKTKQ